MRAYDPDCGVWINNDKLRPTKKEVEEYNKSAELARHIVEAEEEVIVVEEPAVEVSEEDKRSDDLLLELANLELTGSGGLEEFDM